MANRGVIVTLTTIITLLCIYYLSFTFFANSYQQKAIAYATDSAGIVQSDKKQFYLDSIWNEEVLDLFVRTFTYQEIEEKALGLGLDLQGGMHVTLEVSPKEILRALSSDPDDPAFRQALSKADEMQKESTGDYVELFFQAYDEVSKEGKLAGIFASLATQDRINFNSDNEEVKEVIREEVNQAIVRSEQIIRSRVDKFGVSQANVQVLGSGRIQVELPGESNPKRVRNYLQAMAQLEFMDVVPAQEFFPFVVRINDYLVKKAEAEKAMKGGTEPESEADGLMEEVEPDSELLVDEGDDAGEQDQLFADEDTAVSDTTAAEQEAAQTSALFTLNRGGQQEIQVYDALIYLGLDTPKINAILNDPEVQALMPPNVTAHWSAKPINPDQGEPLYTLRFLRRDRMDRAPLTGESVAKASWYNDPAGSGIVISMTMNLEGARIWQKMTKAASERNPKGKIAIVLDDYVYSAPTVQGEIPGGQSSITGNFSIEEAQDLSNILKVGKLPAPTRIVEEAVVGPSLGRVAQSQGLTSVLVGLALVIVFMIVYYAKGGFVANTALLINIFFIFGVLSQFGASLTLPGIAGIVLTIGMSIDANVLIFERIREELRNGNNLLNAINQGYDRAFLTIVDANLTTLLTGVFLLVFGAGPIQGFAITLIIGILCSFFTAVFVSRVIVSWMTKNGNESKVSFAMPFTQDLFANLNIDILSMRKTSYVFSGVVIAVGTVLMFTNGLNLGVDFKGGRSYVIELDEAVEPSKLEADLEQKLSSAFEVKTYDTRNKLSITTNLRVDEESSEADEEVRSEVMGAVAELTGKQFVENQKEVSAGTFDVLKQTKVGATIADDIRTDAFYAVVSSLVAIFLYIWVRFRRPEFGVGAIIALFHDTLMVLSFFAIASLFGFTFEVDQIFVAAMLTVLGYSINDTVVVFDRIREFLSLTTEKEKRLTETINNSINTTLNRTMITSFTTLLVVLILFLFGGEALQGFSFALLVGVLFGTYSSIFIATPTMLDTRPLFKRGAAESHAPAQA